jgi:ubiquinone biosynthesis protein
VQHVIDVLGLDRPPIDPTALTADELVAEMQHSIKTLLGIGARLPKELMLFVKNLMFLDGAIATLAPDLDLFAEVESIALMFATKHGEQIMSQLGLEQQADWTPDLSGVKASFGLDESTEHLTHRELQERRAQVREKFEDRGRQRRGRGPRR